ncbi:hypothetical protein C8Q74DRAFT_1220952 [Fomes fomentarius]|nr:hypothetical protein C8Q74DRAFT_1220952 [Fomes fomentarius]
MYVYVGGAAVRYKTRDSSDQNSVLGIELWENHGPRDAFADISSVDQRAREADSSKIRSIWLEHSPKDTPCTPASLKVRFIPIDETEETVVPSRGDITTCDSVVGAGEKEERKREMDGPVQTNKKEQRKAGWRKSSTERQQHGEDGEDAHDRCDRTVEEKLDVKYTYTRKKRSPEVQMARLQESWVTGQSWPSAFAAVGVLRTVRTSMPSMSMGGKNEVAIPGHEAWRSVSGAVYLEQNARLVLASLRVGVWWRHRCKKGGKVLAKLSPPSIVHRSKGPSPEWSAFAASKSQDLQRSPASQEFPARSCAVRFDRSVRRPTTALGELVWSAPSGMEEKRDRQRCERRRPIEETFGADTDVDENLQPCLRAARGRTNTVVGRCHEGPEKEDHSTDVTVKPHCLSQIGAHRPTTARWVFPGDEQEYILCALAVMITTHTSPFGDRKGSSSSNMHMSRVEGFTCLYIIPLSVNMLPGPKASRGHLDHTGNPGPQRCGQGRVKVPSLNLMAKTSAISSYGRCTSAPAAFPPHY